jgi:hypothetical protein
MVQQLHTSCSVCADPAQSLLFLRGLLFGG